MPRIADCARDSGRRIGYIFQRYAVARRFANRSRLRSLAASLTMLLSCMSVQLPAQGDGSQFGGPQRNFQFPGVKLSNSWPLDGPPRQWEQTPVGGHSGIVVSGNKLFTLLRQGHEEIAIAAASTSGTTIWRRAEEVLDANLDYGMGPFATPLVRDQRVVFLGATGIMRVHDIESGELIWRRELDREFPGSRALRGFASSPLQIDNHLFLLVGATDAAIVAVDATTGRTVWQRHDFGADYTSPLALNVGGSTQIVCQMESQVVGLVPANGDLLWTLPSESSSTRHVISPIDLRDGHVLVGTSYRTRRIAAGEDDAQVVWTSRRIQAQLGNLLYLPQHEIILGASAARTGSPIVALDAGTGELLWKDRGLERIRIFRSRKSSFSPGI